MAAGLPWVRLDANVGTHDKVLALVHDPSPKRWQALTSYFIALGWSGGQGTDGRVPAYALPAIQGTPATARLLVKHGLWIEKTGAWEIKNWAERQELSAITAGKNEARRVAAEKANCKRWHGPLCWSDKKGCTRA
jgi:hypothetical protein